MHVYLIIYLIIDTLTISIQIKILSCGTLFDITLRQDGNVVSYLSTPRRPSWLWTFSVLVACMRDTGTLRCCFRTHCSHWETWKWSIGPPGGWIRRWWLFYSWSPATVGLCRGNGSPYRSGWRRLPLWLLEVRWWLPPVHLNRRKLCIIFINLPQLQRCSAVSSIMH